MSNFIDHYLKEIRSGLSLAVLAAGAYIIFNSRHSRRITRVDSIRTFPHRLGGRFLVRDQRIYFNHIPAFHRFLSTPSKHSTDTKESIPVEWIGMKLKDEVAVQAAIDGRMGKLIVYGERDEMARGIILVKSHSYSPVLRDPALPLLRAGAILYSRSDIVPKSISRRYEQEGDRKLLSLWRFLARKRDSK
jgi:hypothetical protein